MRKNGRWRFYQISITIYMTEKDFSAKIQINQFLKKTVWLDVVYTKIFEIRKIIDFFGLKTFRISVFDPNV